MNIYVCELNVDYIVHSIQMNENIKKYAKEGKSSFYIESVIVDKFEDLDPKDCILTSKYYALYKYDDKLIQVQYDEEKIVIGRIIYENNSNQIKFYLINNSKTEQELYLKEYVLSEYALYYIVLKEKDALFIHSSSFVYNNKGVLLIAKSGTGKSTHSRLWAKYGNMTYLNDDKNFILFKDDKAYIYPNPYSGKHHIDNNIISTLNYLVFIHRGTENKVITLKKREELIEILPHMSNTSFALTKEKWNTLIDKLIKVTGLRLFCNISEEAYLTLKERIDEDEN